jgi:signal transduction histidine kinase
VKWRLRLYLRFLLPVLLGVIVFYVSFNVFLRTSLGLPFGGFSEWTGNEATVRTFIVGIGITLLASGALVAFMTQRASRRLEKIREMLERREPIGPGAMVEISKLDEIGLLIDSFNAASVRTKDEHDAEVSRYRDILKAYSNLSHDLRTPIASVIGYAELLAEGKFAGPEEARRDAAVILRRAITAEKIVNDLLEFTRLKVVRIALNVEKLDLASLLRECVIVLYPLIEKAGISYEFDIAEERMEIEGDRFQLERVFLNLLDNAVKYGRPGKSVSVRISATAENAEVRIRDRGPGIPEKDLARVFERFYRSESSGPERIRGYGLGLAVVREIVERHGGSLRVDSALGKGTTVTVRLPRRAPGP